MNHHYPPIGVMNTCFAEKFGVPRQSMMVSEARGILKLNPDPAYAQALHQLDSFSHVWILFIFHKSLGSPWQPRIEPPRTDGPRTVGVFASRSPNRPNPIGMSVLKLDSVDLRAPGGIEIHLSGVDILDGTPVLDIKPYLPYADIVAEANQGWASGEIPRFEVEFSAVSLSTLAGDAGLKLLIEQTLSWDPRPRSQREAMPVQDPATEGKKFRFRLKQFDVEWQVSGGRLVVLELLPLK